MNRRRFITLATSQGPMIMPIEREVAICGVPGFVVHRRVENAKTFGVTDLGTGFSVTRQLHRSVETAVRGAEAYVRGFARRYRTTPEDCIVRARDATRDMKRRNTGRITFSSPDLGSVTASQRIALNIDELIGVKFRAMGTVEGLLETLSAKGAPKDKIKCSIFDPISSYRMPCYIPLAQQDDAKSAWPMGRIAVYGEIRYAKNGRILSVDVDIADRIRRLKSSADLPQTEDLKGIDITGGHESSDYVRRNRDSE